jgi:hypothetical protein
MALFPLGILSAAGAGGVQGDYELIQTQILGSAQAEVVFSSLATYASTYKHLQIRYVARSSIADTDTVLDVKFNSQSSTYRTHTLYGLGSSVVSASTVNQILYGIPGANLSSGIFGAGVVDILDSFSSTKNTTVRALHGVTGSYSGIFLSSIGWFDTASITTITLSLLSSNLVAGSRFSLYGIRG